MSRRFGSRLLSGLAAATLLAFGTASAQAAESVRLRPNATLAARGAAVKVVVRVACEAPKPSPSRQSKRTVFYGPESPPSINVELTQRVGKFVASGTGFDDDLTCDGKAHRVAVWVTPWNRGFEKGVAFARVALGKCDEYGSCTTARDDGEITIR